MRGMGIFRRGADNSDRQQEAQRPAAPLDDCPVPVLLVLDDLIEVMDLVAGRTGTRARAAAERAAQLREIRRELHPPEQDPDCMCYGRGEWLTTLCWLLSDQDLIGLYEADSRGPVRG